MERRREKMTMMRKMEAAMTTSTVKAVVEGTSGLLRPQRCVTCIAALLHCVEGCCIGPNASAL